MLEILVSTTPEEVDEWLLEHVYKCVGRVPNAETVNTFYASVEASRRVYIKSRCRWTRVIEQVRIEPSLSSHSPPSTFDETAPVGKRCNDIPSDVDDDELLLPGRN